MLWSIVMSDGRLDYVMKYCYAWWKVKLCFEVLLGLIEGEVMLWSIVMPYGRLDYAMKYGYAWWTVRLYYEVLLCLMEG